jgi:hypothetical protein
MCARLAVSQAIVKTRVNRILSLRVAHLQQRRVVDQPGVAHVHDDRAVAQPVQLGLPELRRLAGRRAGAVRADDVGLPKEVVLRHGTDVERRVDRVIAARGVVRDLCDSRSNSDY